MDLAIALIAGLIGAALIGLVAGLITGYAINRRG